MVLRELPSDARRRASRCIALAALLSALAALAVWWALRDGTHEPVHGTPQVRSNERALANTSIDLSPAPESARGSPEDSTTSDSERAPMALATVPADTPAVASGSANTFTLELTFRGDAPSLGALARATLTLKRNSVEMAERHLRAGEPVEIPPRRVEQVGGRTMLRLESLPFGVWGAELRGDTLDPQQFDIAAERGVAVVRRDVEVHALRTISVVFRDSDGADLPSSRAFDGRTRALLVERLAPIAFDAPPDAAHRAPALWRAKRTGNDSLCVFTLTTRHLGELWIGAGFGDAALAWAQAPLGVDEIVLTLSPDALAALTRRVHVLVLESAFHRPVAGAHVSATIAGVGDASGDTGPDGRAHLELLAPGRGSLEVELEGYATVRRELDTRGEPIDEIVVEIEPHVAVRGRLVHADGAPSSGWVNAIEESYGDRLLERREKRVRANADGTFEILELAPAVYYVVDDGSREDVRRYLTSRGLGHPVVEPDAVKVDLRHGSVANVLVRVAK